MPNPWSQEQHRFRSLMPNLTTLHGAYDEQASLTPDATALVGCLENLEGFCQGSFILTDWCVGLLHLGGTPMFVACADNMVARWSRIYFR